jgi:hypothetical protein
MNTVDTRRWGKLLDILAQLSDIERQLVTQAEQPGSFIPDELLDHWYHTYRSGRGLDRVGLSDEVQAILMDFDMTVMDLIEILPEDTDDKAHYIRNDEVWRAIRELADMTLTRIALLGIPQEPTFSAN